jgi:hypothetical protein
MRAPFVQSPEETMVVLRSSWSTCLIGEGEGAAFARAASAATTDNLTNILKLESYAPALKLFRIQRRGDALLFIQKISIRVKLGNCIVDQRYNLQGWIALAPKRKLCVKFMLISKGLSGAIQERKYHLRKNILYDIPNCYVDAATMRRTSHSSLSPVGSSLSFLSATFSKLSSSTPH